MDLILWRHAEAEEEREGLDDLERGLTSRGEKQAARVARFCDPVKHPEPVSPVPVGGLDEPGRVGEL